METRQFIFQSVKDEYKDRAWRAVLNVRHSWLSREVALTFAFVGFATLWLAGAPGSHALGAQASLVGFAALFAADSLVLIGEAIDRGEYYNGLERESPRRQMDLALSVIYPSTFVTSSSWAPSAGGTAGGSTGAPAINTSAR